MFKKLIAAGAIAAGLALASPVAANAATQSGYYNLGPGQTACITSPNFAYANARADGNVYSGHQVRFTFGTTSSVLYDTGIPVTAFAAEANTYTYPWAFPSRFRTCAINQSQKASSVYLSLQTN